MAKRPRVGVTGNARRWAPSWWCTSLALRLIGATPERITVEHPYSGLPLSALIIGGGNDIGPEHYGGDITAKIKTDPERDKLEMQWINKALANSIPLLGICRGSQLINVVLGGSLHQDITDMRKLTHNRPSLMPTKCVSLTPGSTLEKMSGRAGVTSSKLWVNSLHHQAVNEPGEGLKIVARDRDNIVQAIESTEDIPILGVQWHPEYLFYLPSQLAIFRWLLSHAKKNTDGNLMDSENLTNEAKQ